MHHIRNPFSLATAAVVIFLFERGAEAAWPETPAWTWWSLAVVGAVIWVVATYWSDIGKLFRKSQPKIGLIPIIEGIDMAWSHMRDVSALPHVDGRKVFQDLTHQMFNGTDRAVRLYGIRPPLQSPALISNAHKYQFQEDGSAIHRFNEDDRVVDLHVHRADVKRWVRDTLAERRKAMQQRRSQG